jgi:hypothetical protein
MYVFRLAATGVLAPAAAVTSAWAPASAAPVAAIGQVVAVGTVAGTGGRAAPGATVDLYAWPSDLVLQGLKPGQVVPRTLIATTTASPAGAFTLRVAPAELAADAVSGTYANLEVQAGTRSWFVAWNTADPAPAIRLHLAGATPAICETELQRQLKPAWAIVGQSYALSNIPSITQSFTYSASQSSTLGVGFSPTAKFGSFSASGTVSNSTTTGEVFPSYGRGNEWYQTLFRVGLYVKACSTGGHVRPDVIVGYYSRPDGWKSGEHVEHPKNAPATPGWACTPYLRGGQFYTQNERAITWSGGLTVTAIGFNGQAQTGYSTSAQVTYVFGQNGYACGTNQNPPYAAQVVAKKYRN